MFKPCLLALSAAFLVAAQSASAQPMTEYGKPSAQDESLALARALSARSYLIARGVSPLKIVVNFASPAVFIADNSTPEGRLENQRVEVELVFVGN